MQNEHWGLTRVSNVREMIGTCRDLQLDPCHTTLQRLPRTASGALSPTPGLAKGGLGTHQMVATKGWRVRAGMAAEKHSLPRLFLRPRRQNRKKTRNPENRRKTGRKMEPIFLRESETTIKIKFAFFKGGWAGWQRGKLSKTLCFVGNATTIKF